MSHDLIVFDVDDLSDFPTEAKMINDYINAHVSQNPEEVEHPTVSVQNMIAEMGEKFGTTLDDESVWNCWPPICLANGRYCMFNLSRGSDITNMTIMMSDAAKKHGLVLIDPQGNNPLLTEPNGGGILDF